MFEIQKENNALHIVFSAKLTNIDQAAEYTKAFLIGLNKKEYVFNIILTMREALINATAHGNKCDQSKHVTYSIKYDTVTGYIIMDFEDEGPGFDWKSVMGREMDISCDCGRGLVIMKTYCSSINYNEKGNHLTLKLKTNNAK